MMLPYFSVSWNIGASSAAHCVEKEGKTKMREGYEQEREDIMERIGDKKRSLLDEPKLESQWRTLQ